MIHEVCHYAIDMAYWRAKPHGPEWRRLMKLMGGEPSATYRASAELDAQLPVRRQKRHRYCCGCREHELSTTRHNRVTAGRATYCCSYCHQTLRYTRPVGDARVSQ
ncbi:MAG: SprT-like domain-containing protein [Halieaceae bacterium]